MGKGMREIEEERAVLLLLDKIDRLVGVVLGQSRLIDRVGFNDFIVLP